MMNFVVNNLNGADAFELVTTLSSAQVALETQNFFALAPSEGKKDMRFIKSELKKVQHVDAKELTESCMNTLMLKCKRSGLVVEDGELNSRINLRETTSDKNFIHSDVNYTHIQNLLGVDTNVPFVWNSKRSVQLFATVRRVFFGTLCGIDSNPETDYFKPPFMEEFAEPPARILNADIIRGQGSDIMYLQSIDEMAQHSWKSRYIQQVDHLLSFVLTDKLRTGYSNWHENEYKEAAREAEEAAAKKAEEEALWVVNTMNSWTPEQVTLMLSHLAKKMSTNTGERSGQSTLEKRHEALGKSIEHVNAQETAAREAEEAAAATKALKDREAEEAAAKKALKDREAEEAAAKKALEAKAEEQAARAEEDATKAKAALEALKDVASAEEDVATANAGNSPPGTKPVVYPSDYLNESDVENILENDDEQMTISSYIDKYIDDEKMKEYKEYAKSKTGQNDIIFAYRKQEQEQNTHAVFGKRVKTMRNKEIPFERLGAKLFSKTYIETYIVGHMKHVYDYNQGQEQEQEQNYKLKLGSLVVLNTKGYDSLTSKVKQGMPKKGETIFRVTEHRSDGEYEITSEYDTLREIVCSESELMVPGANADVFASKAARKQVISKVAEQAAHTSDKKRKIDDDSSLQPQKKIKHHMGF